MCSSDQAGAKRPVRVNEKPRLRRPTDSAISLSEAKSTATQQRESMCVTASDLSKTSVRVAKVCPIFWSLLKSTFPKLQNVSIKPSSNAGTMVRRNTRERMTPRKLNKQTASNEESNTASHLFQS